jgi:putative transposase
MPAPKRPRRERTHDWGYIEHHQLDDPKPVYIISIFENFSRKVLASTISRTQNQWDYLSVLAEAIRRYGAPEYLVTDGGGIFYSTIALQIYDSLAIQKERIEPGAPWQNYAETLFSIQRRLANYGFSKATTWPEMVSEHQKWMRNYNIEHHFAHRERQDGRHSPDDVLRGVLGRTYPEPVLDRILYATCFTRYPDRYGYVRFRNWRLFGENGLAGEEVSMWVYEGQIKIEYQETPLSIFTVTFQPDHKHIAEVKNPRRIETHFRSPQLELWQY